jgi:hypothetical protein
MGWWSKLRGMKTDGSIGGIPWYIVTGGWGIDLLGDDEGRNVAKGEIQKFNYVESCQGQHRYNDQVTSTEYFDGQEYSCIWRHIYDDWFKLVGKWKASPWTCQ